VANQLGIDKVSVLGVSGGGYALACANRIAERLRFVAVVSGMGPAYRPEAHRDMAKVNRMLYALSHRMPLLTRALTSTIFRGAAFTLARPPSATSNPTNLWTDPTTRTAILDDLHEAVIRPGTRGIVQELALYAQPWGFALEDIAITVHLWHGTTDVNAPAALIKYMARGIPQSQLHLMPGDHLTPIEQISEPMNLIRLTTETPSAGTPSTPM
jgi:pimeloyl-ACP methyl ester carboxylesterase